MDLMYCERCGCWFIPKDPEVGDYVLGKVQSVDGKNVYVGSANLCRKCSSAFVDWMSIMPDRNEVE